MITRILKRVGLRLHRFVNQLVITKDFQEKLRYNYHTLTWVEKILYWAKYRRTLSPTERFFFEGERGLAGQMYIRDRQALHNAIVRFNPRHCLEIGTWTGGGSTFFLAQAFNQIGRGTLRTLEVDKRLHDQAVDYYKKNLPDLAKHIEFIHGNGLEGLKSFLENEGGLDACFLDGAEDSQETVEQYEFLKPYFRSGTILMAHDWNTEKMATLKPIISNSTAWKLVEQIDPPDSVGFVIFQHE